MEKLPCVDCITLPICRRSIDNLIILDCILRLAERCSIIRDFVLEPGITNFNFSEIAEYVKGNEISW